VATGSADHDENLIALGIDTDVHGERVPRSRRVVHEVRGPADYWICN